MTKMFIAFECGCFIEEKFSPPNRCPRHKKLRLKEKIRACSSCGINPVCVARGCIRLCEYCYTHKENPDVWKLPHDFIE